MITLFRIVVWTSEAKQGFFIPVLMRTGSPRLPQLKGLLHVELKIPPPNSTCFLYLPVSWESSLRTLWRFHVFQGELSCLLSWTGIGFLPDIPNPMCEIPGDLQQPWVCSLVYKMMKHVWKFNRWCTDMQGSKFKITREGLSIVFVCTVVFILCEDILVRETH